MTTKVNPIPITVPPQRLKTPSKAKDKDATSKSKKSKKKKDVIHGSTMMTHL